MFNPFAGKPSEAKMPAIVKQLEKAATQLDRGIQANDQQFALNLETQQRAREENEKLKHETTKAQRIKDGLKSIFGETI